MLTANTKAPQRGSKQTAQEWRRLLPCHLCAVAGRNAVLPLRWLSTSGSHCANVGGHAIPELCSPTRGLSQRDTCHVCAAYVLLRRWERLRGGASAGMASPPTSTFHTFYGRDTSRPYINLQPSPNTQHPTPNKKMGAASG